MGQVASAVGRSVNMSVELGRNLILANLHRVWRHLSVRRKWQLYSLGGLIVVASVVEVFSIGAIVPLLGVLVAPEAAFESPLMQPLKLAFAITEPASLIMPVALLFCAGTVASGFVRYLLLLMQARVTYAIGAELSTNIFERTLYQPYLVHVSRNSSEVIAGVSTKANELIVSLLYPAAVIVSAVVTLIMVLGALAMAEPEITFVTIGVVSAIYIVMSFTIRRRLRGLGETISRNSSMVVRLVQEGLGGIRDILLDGNQPQFVSSYRQAERSLRMSRASMQVLSGAPRFFVETLGTLSIVAFAMSVALAGEDVKMSVPLLGMMALAAQRLLPIIQQGYSAWAAIQGGRSSVNDALDLLEQPVHEDDSEDLVDVVSPFAVGVEFVGVSFSYGAGLDNVLTDVTLKIPKGSRTGVIGTTGSGKSTFLDLVMGLIPPTSGRICIDGNPLTPESVRGWQRQLAHVPQTIYLADCSLAENIAFGVQSAKIDHKRIVDAARTAQLDEFIDTLPQGYATNVGERGVRLSGGQRQRIGIARALYKGASVIVLDEATSALDSETEGAVMEGIHSLPEKVTLLIVAHRTTTLRHCTQLLEVHAGVVRSVESLPRTVKAE